METLYFQSTEALRDWLVNHHASSPGFWLRIAKKDSGEPSVTYAEALDQALCFGWIDGQKKTLDEKSWLQRFTPRMAKSGWSKKNIEHVERLTRDGLMTLGGMQAVEAAKADGRWALAYDSPKNAAPPDDFLQALDNEPAAKAFFETLNKANVYAIVYRLQTAKKPETRQKRMTLILEMLARGEKFH